MMFRPYLWRGLKAGLLAGIGFALVIALVGNPLIGAIETASQDHATEHEEAHAGEQEASGEHAGEETHAMSTAVTNGISIGGGVLWGLLLGLVTFGIVFYFLEPAIPGTGAAKSYVLAAAGFITVSGGPWLALPPQPGGVEQALTQETRLFWFVAMVVASALTCLLAASLYNRLVSNRRRVVAAIAALAPFGLLLALATVAPANTISGPISSTTVTLFRGVTVLGQIGLWVLLATAHARFHQRAQHNTPELDVETAGHTAD